LKQGFPFIDFEATKMLFQFLKMNNIAKNLSNNVGWEIAQVQYHIFLITTKVAIHAMRYTKLNCDEVTMMEIQSWFNIHVYLVKDFKRI
jgi:hypothetical protein